ncbi:MAG: hypothetical protein ACREV2_07430 [Burkholderiales bacterium]
MRTRRFLVYFTLLLLTSAQQAGFAHALAHATGEIQNEQSLPHSQVCGECLAYAPLGGAAQSSPGVFEAVSLVHEPALDAGDFHTPFFLRAFASRAPPILL